MKHVLFNCTGRHELFRISVVTIDCFNYLMLILFKFSIIVVGCLCCKFALNCVFTLLLVSAKP